MIKNDGDEQILAERLRILKLIASEYHCTITEYDGSFKVIHEKRVIHIFARADILYTYVSMRDFFVNAIKDKIS